MILDHLAVAGASLEAAVDYVEEKLGVKMLPGGKHVHFGTHNRLLGLADGLYLEAIAIDPEALPLPYARWFDLDRFSGSPRLSKWICRSEDIDAEVARLKGRSGAPVALARGALRWRMAVPADGILPMGDCYPAIMQWDVDQIPGDSLAVSGCRLIRLEVAHPEAETLQAELAFQDPRVVFVNGDDGLSAEFETPHGTRVLG